MTLRYLHKKIWFLALFAIFFTNYQISAQTSTVTLCDNPNLYISNNSQNAILDFSSNIPSGNVVTDVSVSVTWSRLQGGCLGLSGLDDVSEVEFNIIGPTGITRKLVGSGTNFSGSAVINNIITNFQDGAALITGLPIDGTTYNPSTSLAQVLPTGTDFLGSQAPGLWRLEFTDLLNNSTGICIQSICITIVSCPMPPLVSSCRASATLNLDNNGEREPTFADLNLASDTSCLLSNVRFSLFPSGSPVITSPFDCTDHGTTFPLYMILTDKLGRTAICPTPTQVTVQDVSEPSVPECDIFSATADTVYLDATGTAVYNASELNVSDACGLSSVTISSGFAVNFGTSITFNCTAGGGIPGSGPNNIYVRATDVNGNTRNTLSGSSSFFPSCRVRLLVFDTIAPIALCHPTRTFALDASGTFTATPSLIDNGSYSDCSPSGALLYRINGQNSVTYNCDSIGTTSAILTVIENNTPQQGGVNFSNCLSVVNIVDVTPPTAICSNSVLSLDASGNASIDAASVAALSTDNCGPLTYSFSSGNSIQNFNCSNLGNNTLTISVTDASGNNSVCVANITVTDITAPTVTCQNINVFLDNTGQVNVAATDVDDGSVDACGILSYLIEGVSSINYTCDSIGARNVSFTVEDASGNSDLCEATINVIDTIPPTAICQNIPLYLDASGLATLSAITIDNGSFDNCDISSRALNNLPSGTALTFDCDSVGARIVELQVNDISGNSGRCAATVTIIDTIAPIAECRNINVFLELSGSVTVDAIDIDNGSVDNCNFTNYQINNVNSLSYDCDSLGARNVVLEVSDVSGNSSFCSAVIIVQDTIAADAQCQDIDVYLSPAGTSSILPIEIDNGSFDNCALASISFNGLSSGLPIDYNCDSVGIRSATLRVEDINGNISFCSSTITVIDSINPTAQCQSINVYLNNLGTVTVNGIDIDNGSNDVCGLSNYYINSIGSESFVFNCADIGPNLVTLYVEDRNGNIDNCTSIVTVFDTIKPEIQCQNANIFLNPTGFALITPALIDNGSFDACNPLTLSVNVDTVRCSDIGSLSVTLIGTDTNGNTDSCIAIVTVSDTVSPQAQCLNPDVYLDATGNVSLTPAMVNNGSFDNCNSISFFKVNGLDSVVFNCVDAGYQNVLLQVFDTDGNVGTCNADVNVIDTISPSAICQAVTLPLDMTGSLILSSSTINNGSFDACGISSLQFNDGNSTRTFDCSNLGLNNITLVVFDANGNSDSCSAQLTIEDITPPQAQCQSSTVYLSDLGVVTLVPSDIDAGSIDVCGIDTMYLSPTNLNCSNVTLPVPVTLTVIDGNNNFNTCIANVTVVDTIRPDMICANPTVYLDATGNVTVSPLQLDGGTSDACGITQRLINGNTSFDFSCADLGLVNAQLTATDVNANSASCTSIVNVVDTVRPVARCRAPFTVYLNGISGTATLTPLMIDSSSSDNCSVVPANYTINNLSAINYTCANAGLSQTVTLRIFDGSNNTSTCSTTITVRDTTDPVAQCLPSITRNLSSASPASVNVPAIALNNASSDVCGGASLSFLINVQPSFNYTCANLGPNQASLTVIDASGNQSTCTSTVIINDITPPIASCIGNFNLNLDSSGQATLVGTMLNNGSADNCGVSNFLVNNSSSQLFLCSDIGSTAVTLTVQDASGNSTNCTSVVTVQDTTPPIARCFSNPVTVYLDATSTVNISGTMIDSASSDNCSITTRLVNNAVSVSYSCVNIGMNNVTLTVRDQSNNSQSCTAQVMVVDTVLPVANCQNINAVLNPSGFAIVNATSLNSGSSDNCILTTYLINDQTRDTFDCTNVGPNVATFTVIDNSGNENFCQSTINVIDNIQPNLSCNNRTFYLDASGFVLVRPDSVATAVDVCGVVNYTIDNLPFRTYDCNSAGTTFSDTIRAFDPSGNPGFCVSQITILDTIRPIASCLNINVSLDSSGLLTVNPSQINLNSTDNCLVTNYLINNQPSISLNCANVGPNTATLTAFDASGNSSSCPATITVVDDIAPIARCRNITVQLDAFGNATVPAINLNGIPSSFDACGPLSFTVNGQNVLNLNCSNLIGTNTVALNITDQNGNSSTCNSNITVVDLTPPNITCRDYTLYLNSSGNGSLVPLDVVNQGLSIDNCSTISYTIGNNQTSRLYSCSDIGLNTILVVGTDPSGNRDSCFANVTVVDTVAPLVNCQSIVVNLTTVVTDTLTLSELGITTQEACQLDTVLFFPNVITCANIGQVPISITAYDIYGNIGYCTSTVTVVLDGAQPSALDTVLCEGETLQLFANPPATGFTYDFSWTGPFGFNSSIQNPQLTNMQGNNSGQYIVTIVPQGVPGCAVSDTIDIEVNTVPPPIITTGGPVCLGDSTIITLSNPSNSYNGTNVTFQWYYEGIPIVNNNDTLIINPIAFSDSGAYTMFVTVDGCSDTSAVPFELVVNPLPPSFNPLADNPCLGDTLSLFANPPLPGPYSYNWSGPSGFTATQQNAIIEPASDINSGLYLVTITDINTCQRIGAVLVNIKSLPEDPYLDYNDPLCSNDVLILTDTVSRVSNTQYIWSTPDNLNDTTNANQFILINPIEGNYTLYVIEEGCISSIDDIEVVFELEPGAFADSYSVPFRDSLTELEVTLNDAIRVGYTIEIIDTPKHGQVIINNNSTLNYTPDFIYHGLDSFVYQICDPVCPTICDSAVVVIDIELDQRCFIPNALSPNGDGINDELIVVCRELYPNMEIQIFSRWGNLVFNGEPNGWDGMYNGANLPDGAYFFVLDYGDGTEPETGYLVISR